MFRDVNVLFFRFNENFSFIGFSKMWAEKRGAILEFFEREAFDKQHKPKIAAF